MLFSRMPESNPILSARSYYKYHNFPREQPLPLVFLHPAVASFSLFLPVHCRVGVPAGGSPAALFQPLEDG